MKYIASFDAGTTGVKGLLIAGGRQVFTRKMF